MVSIPIKAQQKQSSTVNLANFISETPQLAMFTLVHSGNPFQQAHYQSLTLHRIHLPLFSLETCHIRTDGILKVAIFHL